MATALTCGLAGAMTLVWMFRKAARPADEVDRHLAAIDADIDRIARDRAALERSSRSRHPSTRNP